MAAGTDGKNVFGQFHQKCGEGVVLSEGRRVASGSIVGPFPIAFSNDPIPKGVHFSVKVLQEGKSNDSFRRLAVCSTLGIGVTTKDPDSGQVPGLGSDDQCWFVIIWRGSCKAWQSSVCAKWQEGRELQWILDRSAGNTFGCQVLETGKLHLHHNGSDVGVAWEGLPTDKPLWGFVILDGGWKLETSYVIAQSHPQDYAGKTFQFVERPPEWLICAVCQSLAHDPVLAKRCGNIYCSRCIEETRSNSCPICRSTEQPDPVFRDQNARRNVLCLSVYCPNSCGKKMELADVEDHLTSDNGCPDQVVECSNKCGHKERRATVKKHMTTECRLRQEKCKYYSFDCPKCGARGVTHSTVPAHQEVCPMQCVECEYKRFGCAIVLPRKDMAQHLKSSVEAHLQMTKWRVKEIEEKAARER